jgi:hypothetical protein
VEGQWGRETTNDTGYNKMARILSRSMLNWRAHVKTRVQQGLWPQQNVARFMQRWGINGKLARTVAWSTSMATAAYGIEAIWEGQP